MENMDTVDKTTPIYGVGQTQYHHMSSTPKRKSLFALVSSLYLFLRREGDIRSCIPVKGGTLARKGCAILETTPIVRSDASPI